MEVIIFPLLLFLFPKELCILIIECLEWKLYSIDFRELCDDLGVLCYLRMKHTYNDWVYRMAKFLNWNHEGVKFRQNGTVPANRPQWGSIKENPFYIKYPVKIQLEINRRKINISPKDRKKRVNYDKAVCIFVYNSPPIGQKNKINEISITNILIKLNTLVVLVPIGDKIYIGVISGNKWLFMTYISFIDILRLYHGTYRDKIISKKVVVHLEMPDSVKDPNVHISPECGENINKHNALMYRQGGQQGGALLIKVRLPGIIPDEKLIIPIHLNKYMTHLYSKCIRTLVHWHWGLNSKILYHASRIGWKKKWDFDTITREIHARNWDRLSWHR